MERIVNEYLMGVKDGKQGEGDNTHKPATTG